MVKGLIILDGPDGAGKTTLGKRICELHNGKYMHLTYRWKSNMFAYHTAALHHAIALSDKQLVVIDRLWMSEVIYAMVYRSGSQWPHMGRMMDRVIRKHAGMYVLCFDESMKEHQDRFMRLKSERVEMYNDTSDVWALYHSLYHGSLGGDLGNDYFEDLARGQGLKARGDVWRYSISKDGHDLDGFISRFLACHQLRRSEQVQFALDGSFHNFLGYAPEAKYLIVGDKLSEKRYRRIGWPFYAYKHCSKYFAEQFSKLGLDETDFCWTNAHEQFGFEVVNMMTATPWNLKPIFLGFEAIGKFKDYEDFNNQAHGFMRHPQWYSRWKTHKDDFRLELTQILEAMKV